MEERDILKEVLKKARVCKTRLEALVDFALAYLDKDLSVIFAKLATALKVSEGVWYSLEQISIKNVPLPLPPHFIFFATIFGRISNSFSLKLFCCEGC